MRGRTGQAANEIQVNILHLHTHEKFNTKNQNWLKREQCDNVFNRNGYWEISPNKAETGLIKLEKELGDNKKALEDSKNAPENNSDSLKFGKFVSNGIKNASNLQEVQNVVDVTFWESVEKINEWTQKSAGTYGMSELSAK